MIEPTDARCRPMRHPLRQTTPVFGLLLLLSATALTFPRLSVESGTTCKNCHMATTGGGARNEFGNFAVAFNELTLQRSKQLLAAHYRKPRVGESLVFGFDSRHLVFDDGRLFRMQTDLFATLEPIKGMIYHARIAETGVTENYVQVQVQDRRHTIKAGRFYPTFGLRNEDHTAFNRERVGLAPRLFLDGLSLSTTIAGADVTLETFNPNTQATGYFHVVRPGSIKSVNYLAGLSFRYTEKVEGDYLGAPHARALFGGLNWDRFTFTGELDLVGERSDTLITYANLTTRLLWGVWLVGEYNFFDSDRHVASGVDEDIRLSVDFYPVPFVQIRPTYLYHTRGYLKDEDDFFIQFHAGY